jgi:hypothetical protein
LRKPRVSLHNPSQQHHQLLEAHLASITRCFDLFFTIPPDRYLGLTLTCWYQMAQYLIFLHRLLYVLDDQSWSPAAARQRVDLFALCDRLARLLSDTGAGEVSLGHDGHVSGSPHDNIFSKFSHAVRTMSNAWLAELQLQQPASEYRLHGVGWKRKRQQVQQATPGRQWPPVSNTHTEIDAMEWLGGYGGTGVTTAVVQPSRRKLDNAWLNELFDVAW